MYKYILPFLIFLATFAYGGSYEIVLQWDRVTDTDLAGYNVYYTNTLGEYDRASPPLAEIPLNQTSALLTVQELPGDGEVYYAFAVVAFDFSLRESGLSPEAYFVSQGGNIIYVEDNQPPATPGGCYITTVKKIP